MVRSERPVRSLPAVTGETRTSRCPEFNNPEAVPPRGASFPHKDRRINHAVAPGVVGHLGKARGHKHTLRARAAVGRSPTARARPPVPHRRFHAHRPAHGQSGVAPDDHPGPPPHAWREGPHRADKAPGTDPANATISLLTAELIGAALEGGGHHRHIEGLCDGPMGRVIGALEIEWARCSKALQIRRYSRKRPRVVRGMPMACMVGR